RPTPGVPRHPSPPHGFGGFGRPPRDPTRLDLRPHAVTTGHAPFGNRGHTAGEDPEVGVEGGRPTQGGNRGLESGTVDASVTSPHLPGVLIDARANRFLTVF